MIDFSRYPKVELHLHLDCSLSYKLVSKINPSITFDQYQTDFIAPGKCPDLADYISRSANAIELMQTKEHLRLATLDVIRQLKEDNVIYAEIRFAPLLHLSGGLTPYEVVDTVNKAVYEGIQTMGIMVGVILCTLRDFSESQSMETIRLVEEFKGTHIVGFDIAADEAGYPIDNHIKAFTYAKENGIPCTAHAGEAKGAESVWETLSNFQPTRIGHGVRSVEDEKLMDFLRENDIHLEVCPTSNVQTNVVNQIDDHPADLIYKKGVSMSINTDGKALSNVTLSHEYGLLANLFSWEKSHFLKCNLEAIRHAFTSEATKNQLTKKILRAYLD